MADRLTQLQDALDELATQFYACIRYISTNHSPPLESINAGSGVGVGAGAERGSSANAVGTPPNAGPSSSNDINNNNNHHNTQAEAGVDPSQQDGGGGGGGGAGGAASSQAPNPTPSVPSPEQFALDQRELARDLILKEQQIEYLISVLPGIGTTELEQAHRVRGLVEELQGAEADRQQALREKDEVLARLDGVITKRFLGAGKSII